MKKEEFIEYYGRDLTEMKVTGVLNADMYQKMNKDDIREFIEGDVKDIAKKFINGFWEEETNVTCEYVVIDTHYNVREKVTATMTYSHANGISNVEVNVKKRI